MLKVPNDIIVKYSQYFRFVENFVHPGPFHCGALSRIEIDHVTLDHSTLDHAPKAQVIMQMIMESKSRISTIAWTGDIWDGVAELELAGSGNVLQLSALPTNITGLELGSWKIGDTSDFLRFLTRYHSLSYLSLSHIFDIHEMPPILELSSLSDLSTRLSSPFLLPNVKNLHLYFPVTSKDAQLEMVKVCPNLESLTIVGSWTTSPTRYHDEPFYRYCPRLLHLSIDCPHEDYNRGAYIPGDTDLAALIRNLTGPPQTPLDSEGRESGSGAGKIGLKSFKIALSKLEEKATEALIAHTAMTLETFDIEVNSYEESHLRRSTSRNLSKILRTFPYLRRIRVECDYDFNFKDDDVDISLHSESDFEREYWDESNDTSEADGDTEGTDNGMERDHTAIRIIDARNHDEKQDQPALSNTPLKWAYSDVGDIDTKSHRGTKSHAVLSNISPAWACSSTLVYITFLVEGWYSRGPEWEDQAVDYGDGYIWVWETDSKVYLRQDIMEEFYKMVREMPKLKSLRVNWQGIYKVRKL
jgi:hypothetical protein